MDGCYRACMDESHGWNLVNMWVSPFVSPSISLLRFRFLPTLLRYGFYNTCCKLIWASNFYINWGLSILYVSIPTEVYVKTRLQYVYSKVRTVVYRSRTSESSISVKCYKMRILVYFLAIGILAWRNAFEEVVCEEIGLYPSSKLLELQTPSKRLLVKFPIEVSKVIALHLLYSRLQGNVSIYA